MDSPFLPQHEAEADDTGKISFPSDELKLIELPPETDEGEKTSVARSEILDFGDQGFLLHNVLSPTECKHFIDEGERVGFGDILGARDNYRGQQRYVCNSTFSFSRCRKCFRVRAVMLGTDM